MVEIAPSILSADFARLGEEIAAAEAGGATVIHCDVMDGHFVPNLTIGLPVVKSLRRATRLPLDTHLMISEPGLYAEKFVEAGAQMVSVHIEADAHIHRTLAAIKKGGLLLEDLLENSEGVVEILALESGGPFLVKLAHIPGNFVEGLFWHGSILLSHS